MNGILLIDKPQGWTSHDVVAKLRGILGTRRIGHSGTLDPLATGLLVCFVGRGTRAAEFFESAEKSYVAGLRTGLTTDTQDITGAVISTSDIIATPEDIESALEGFRGEQLQMPPMYSAVKIGGKKLYEYARQGVEISRKPRRIHIYDLRLTGESGGDFELYIRCSKGTYVRTLCHDIGLALGTGAVMSSLRRVGAGGFDISEAYSLEQVEKAAASGEAESLLLPIDSIFMEYKDITLAPDDVRKTKNGAKINAAASNGIYRLYSEEGEFLALSEVKGGVASIVKTFFNV